MHNICCAGRKRCARYLKPSGYLKPDNPTKKPENQNHRFYALCLGELWPHASGSGHKKQFSVGAHTKKNEATAAAAVAVAAITITCFLINYSLRNAGDRPKTTTVTVTQWSRLAGRKLDLTMCSSSGCRSSSKKKKKKIITKKKSSLNLTHKCQSQDVVEPRQLVGWLEVFRFVRLHSPAACRYFSCENNSITNPFWW